jgi:hypothetical protein
VQAINEFLTAYPALTFYLGALAILAPHFFGKSTRMAPLSGLVLILTALIFVGLWHTPEPIEFALVVAVLAVYSASLLFS